MTVDFNPNTQPGTFCDAICVYETDSGTFEPGNGGLLFDGTVEVNGNSLVMKGIERLASGTISATYKTYFSK